MTAPYKLTEEEIAAGVTIHVNTDELVVADVSDRNLERMARGFIMGTQAIGRRREIKVELEERVIKKMGRKGKYLTDKLFELIEGVYVMDGKGGKDGKSIKYYQVPPSLPAIVYALDRVLGKPKQQIDKTEEKKGIILVEHVIRNLAQNPYRDVGRKNEGTNNIGTGEGGGEETGSGVDGLAERITEGVGEGVV
mgnify:CR=1 FL=1